MIISSGIIPSLIHGVDVEIQRLDTLSTVYDPEFREPVGDAQYSANEKVFAQVHWDKESEMSAVAAGDDEITMGWLTMRKIDLDDIVKGAFKKSDKIVLIDGVAPTRPLFIKDLARKAQYTEFKLVKFFFFRRGTE